MITDPVNDVACLSKITDRTIDASERDDVRNLAARFASCRELATWIRTLPQRNDDGNPYDGPRVTCDVSQRLRIPADDPNCVERSALYLATAELIDPRPLRQLATIDTPIGRHTFPVENDTPVRLDPRVPRNALHAGLFRMSEPDAWDPSARETLQWIGRIAAEPAARYSGGRTRVRNARRAFYDLVRGTPLRRNSVDDMGFALALAEHAAQSFGVRGLERVKLGSMAVRYALRNATRPSEPRNLSISIGGLRLGIPTPDFAPLSTIAHAGARIGTRIGGAAIRVALNQVGINDTMIRQVEKELKREGMSRGVAAAPPIPGTLEAMAASKLLH